MLCWLVTQSLDIKLYRFKVAVIWKLDNVFKVNLIRVLTAGEILCSVRCVWLICFSENVTWHWYSSSGRYIGSLSSNVAIFMDVWDGRNLILHTVNVQRLWEASMKCTPDSSVKLKDKDWYRCQCKDSLGAICYYMWSDNRCGTLQDVAQKTELLSLLFVLWDCWSYRIGYMGTFTVCKVLNQKQGSALCGTVQCNTSYNLFICLFVCLQLSFFPFSKHDATSL